MNRAPRAKRSRGSLRSALAAVALLAGCGSSEPPTQPDATGCPVDPSVRPFVEQIAIDELRNTAWVGSVRGAAEVGSALAPFGFSTSLGRSSFDARCTGPATFGAFCVPRPEFAPFSFCVRTRCEGADVWLEDSYFVVQPHVEADDRHRVEYDSRSFPGRVVYGRNPLVTYRIDHTTAGTVRVTTDIVQELSFIPRGGAAVDLSHAGRVSHVSVGAAVRSFTMDLTFSALSAARPVILHFDVDANGMLTGTVTASGRRIATVVGLDHTFSTAPTYTWEGDCRPVGTSSP